MAVSQDPHIIRLAEPEWDIASCDLLYRILAPALTQPDVIIDMSAVTYLDSSCLSKLIKLYVEARDQKRLRPFADGHHVAPHHASLQDHRVGPSLVHSSNGSRGARGDRRQALARRRAYFVNGTLFGVTIAAMSLKIAAATPGIGFSRWLLTKAMIVTPVAGM